jgi:hypothetical protein
LSGFLAVAGAGLRAVAWASAFVRWLGRIFRGGWLGPGFVRWLGRSSPGVARTGASCGDLGLACLPR